jgi:hypothetical protein
MALLFEFQEPVVSHRRTEWSDCECRHRLGPPYAVREVKSEMQVAMMQ